MDGEHSPENGTEEIKRARFNFLRPSYARHQAWVGGSLKTCHGSTVDRLLKVSEPDSVRMAVRWSERRNCL